MLSSAHGGNGSWRFLLRAWPGQPGFRGYARSGWARGRRPAGVAANLVGTVPSTFLQGLP